MARSTHPRRDPARWLRPGLLACLLLALAELPPSAHAGCDVAIGAEEARALADKVWRNESGRDVDKILWWNRGEDFPSLGIGHFIWYPPGVDGPFQESFPQLLAFLSARGVALPAWLAGDPSPGSPWLTREQFLDARNGRRRRRFVACSSTPWACRRNSCSRACKGLWTSWSMDFPHPGPRPSSRVSARW